MGDESTRWTIVIDKQTDIDVRTRLAAKGMKKGDLSKYVSELVRRDLFMDTWREFSEGFKDLSDQEVDDLVDEAVTWARGRKP